MTTWPVLRALLQLLLGRQAGTRADFAAAAGWEVVGILVGVAGPFLLKLVVDGLSDTNPDTAWLAVLIALFVISWSGTGLVGSLKYVHTMRIIDKVTLHLGQAALKGQLPLLARERSGDTGRVLGLIERLPHSLQVVIDGLIFRAAPVLVQVAVALAVMCAVVPLRYAVIMAVVLGVYLAAVHLGASRYHLRARAANDAASAVSQALGDVLRNARRVVFNGTLDPECAVVADRARAKQRANLGTTWALVRLSGFQFAVVGGGLIVMLLLSSTDVVSGRLTVGDFVLLQAFAFRLALPLSSFGFILRQAGVSIANIADVLALADNRREAVTGAPIVVGAAAVRLNRLGFRYGAEQWALREVDALIPAGSFAAIVGSNGSGKSTLAQLIAGQLEPTEGMVAVGDHDLAQVPRTARHLLALYVPQFIGLFNRSLRSNALYPPTEQTEGELRALLETWRFYEGGRPVDFDLIVGEQGERLSAGQIQKLELARLVGVRTPLLILDESTSSLDVTSEMQTIGALRARFGAETTLLLITHHVALAAAADLVLYLRGGRLVAAGQHDMLMNTSPIYREFWSPQDRAEPPAAGLVAG